MEWTDVYLAVLGLALAGSVGFTLRAYQRSRGRWGADTSDLRERGDGAYRSITVGEVALRFAPKRVAAAALSTRIWAIVTLLVFVPAGAAAVLVSVAMGGHPVAAVLGLGVGILVLSGLGLGFALARSAHAVELRSDLDDARFVARWSFWHHALVAGTFVALGWAIEPDLAAAALVLVVPVCLVGALVTVGLRAAAIRGQAAS